MMEHQQTTPWEYCRFCAELINSEKLMVIEANIASEVSEKLNMFNLKLYSQINETILSKVCFVCWNNFNTAYEFFETFRKAQDRLRELKHENQLDTVTTKEIREAYYFNDSKADEYYKEEEEDNQPLITFQSKLPKISELTPSKCNQTEVKTENNCESKTWLTYPWLCKICRAVLPNIDSLREHSKTEHLLCPQFVCVDCDNYKFRSFNRFIFHVASHRKYMKNVCIYCDKYSDTPRKHYKSHYSPPKEQCNTCGEVFDNEDFKEHQLMYNPFFTSTASDNINNTKEVLNNNRLEEQSILKTKQIKEVCENDNENTSKTIIICNDNNEFNSKNSMSENRKNISSKSNKNTKRRICKPRRRLTIKELTCTVCHKLFTNGAKLINHKLKVHNLDDRPALVCDQCAKIFKTEPGLKAHKENHDRKKTHQCKLCTKSYTQLTNLRTHVKLHLGIKPFICDHCQKGFSGRSFLSRHIIVAHGPSTYSCQFCSKKFKTRDSVKRHEWIHTGEKPFECQECGMRFNNYPNFVRHCKARHDVNLAKSKYTPAGPVPIDPSTGKVVELLDPATCPEWTKDLFSKKYKRNKKKA